MDVNISVNNKKNTFHLYNDEISYIISVLPTRHLGQLYYGRRIREREDYSGAARQTDVILDREGRAEVFP